MEFFFVRGISSMVMGGIFKYGVSESNAKGSLEESHTFL